MATTTNKPQDDLNGLAYDLAILGNSTRLKILGYLGLHPRSSVEDLMQFLALPQSVVSRHLMVLRHHDLVIFDEEGVSAFKKHCYSLKPKSIQADAERLSALARGAA